MIPLLFTLKVRSTIFIENEDLNCQLQILNSISIPDILKCLIISKKANCSNLYFSVERNLCFIENCQLLPIDSNFNFNYIGKLKFKFKILFLKKN